MAQENDATIVQNNELTVKISELSNEIGELTERTIPQLSQALEQRNTAVREKEELIKEFEEEMKNANRKLKDEMDKNTEMKINSDAHLIELNEEIERLQKEKEALDLSRQKEATAISQERLDHKKLIKAMKGSMECLNREKAELEYKLSKTKLKHDVRKCLSKETQTESAREVFAVRTNEKLGHTHSEELSKLQQYISSLKAESSRTASKLAAANNKVLQLSQALKASEEAAQTLKELNAKLCTENLELKNRREKAIVEIERLNQLARKSFHVEGNSQQKGSKRSASETVHARVSVDCGHL